MTFSTFNKSAVFVLAAAIGLSTLACSQGRNGSVKSDLAFERTQWMYEGKVGISTHYCPWKIDEVEDVASSFQVEKVAEQVDQAGAKWFLLTMHHQPWLMMAPNKTYDDLLGHSKYTAQRDVPMELYDALAGRSIRMMIYLNLRLDPGSLCNKLDENIGKSMGNWPPDQKLIDNIAAVYREFSLRYGDKVAGWLIDGPDLGSIMHAEDREKWFTQIVEALRAGNPNAAIAFNPGAERWYRFSDQNDFLAGETNGLTFWPDEGRLYGGAQWHVRTHLGNRWKSGGCRYTDAEVINYAKAVTAAGGVLTFDVGTTGIIRPLQGVQGETLQTEHIGYIDPTQVEQIRAVTEALEIPSK